MKKIFLILTLLLIAFTTTLDKANAATCECEVGNLKGTVSECSLLYFIANQRYSGKPDKDCTEITFAPGLTGTIVLNASPYIYENVKLVGNTNADGSPKITLKAGSTITTDYLMLIKGERTDSSPTIENIAMEAPGKTALKIESSATGHLFKNIHVKNSDVGINSFASNVTFENISAYNNNEGIIVTDSNINHITSVGSSSSRSLFYNNSNKAILLSNGNNDLPYPTKVVAVVKQGGSSVVGMVGLLDPAVTNLEMYEADAATLDQAQAQGKFFVNAVTPTIFSWDVNGQRRFSSASTKMMTGRFYTLTAFDDLLDTSEFSGKFGSTEDDTVTGDTPCLSATWFMRALDGDDKYGNAATYLDANGSILSSFNGDPWIVDSDGDDLSNLKEDKDQDCVVDDGETDPKIPNYQFPFYKFPRVDVPPFIDRPCFDIDMDGQACDDNCVFTYNPDQKDSDKDGIGDVCEGDRDDDDIPDDNDNCPDVPNTNQLNTDGDLLGNVCDPDIDNDGLTNDEENEAGTDSDDTDSDDDGFCDGTGWGYTDHECTPMDNCPLVSNADQKDSDNDGIGDKCDMEPQEECAMTDSDEDGVADYLDNCPRIANAKQSDGDADGNGDPCDFYDNTTDKQYAAEFGKFTDDYHKYDMDGDGTLDTKDTDIDNDGKANGADNCPSDWNPEQRNSDGDDAGDVCDNYDDLNFMTYAEESQSYLVKWWVLYPQTIIGKMMIHADCDADDDGRPNKDDNCPGMDAIDQKECIAGKGPALDAPDGAHVCWNYQQEDADNDGIGDICDNCLSKANGDQKDTDGDGYGDACDNCPSVVNADQDADACKNTPDPDTDTGVTTDPVISGYADIEGGGGYSSGTSGCGGNLSGATPIDAASAIPFALMCVPLAIFTARRKFKI